MDTFNPMKEGVCCTQRLSRIMEPKPYFTDGAASIENLELSL
jgi:hypothetical protein